MRLPHMTLWATLAAMTSAAPAAAASGPFFSLGNTNFVVTLGFITFLLILLYFKVPKMLGGMLDQRAEGIKSEIEEARALREEAQSLLASYERKQQEVQAQADRIVAAAKDEANVVAERAREDLAKSIERRLAAAQEQISSAEAQAVKEVRDQAVTIAISAAQDVIEKQMDAKNANTLIDAAIGEVAAKLH